jgi:hypothetical protein
MVRAKAPTSPVASEAAMIRRMGPVRGPRPMPERPSVAGSRWVGCAVVAMSVRFGEEVVVQVPRVGAARVSHPGGFTGIAWGCVQVRDLSGADTGGGARPGSAGREKG